MPVLDEATYSDRRAGSFPATVSSSNGPAVSLPIGVKTGSTPLVDLLDLGSDDVPAPRAGGGFLQDLLGIDLSIAPSQSGATSQNHKTGTDVLLDLLSIESPHTANSSSTTADILSLGQETMASSTSLERMTSLSSGSAQVPSSVVAPMMDLLDGLAPSPPIPEKSVPEFPSVVAYESLSLKIIFDFSKLPGEETTSIKATFLNLSPNPFTDFVFQAAVPKFLQLQLDSASDNTLPPGGSNSITQNMQVTNSQQGKKSLVMRVRISYKINGKDALEQGQISNFPRGL